MNRSVSLFAGCVALMNLLAPASAPAAESAPAQKARVMAPYLQNPAPDGMTVCFMAQGVEAVQVEWGAPPVRTGAVSTAIPGTPWTVWKTRIGNLGPGTTHPYKVRFRVAGEDRETAAYQFRTPDPNAASLRFAVFNDIHNRDATLAALMKHVRPEDYEFSILLGDCWSDPSASGGAGEVFRILEAYIRLLDASNKPMMLVRGNHETRGNFAGKLAYLFDIPGLDPTAAEGAQNWYFHLRAGPAWLLALDGGEDFTKRMEIYQPIRERQTPWMKEAFAAAGAGKIPWRILLTHMPLYNDNIWNSEPCRLAWEPTLKTLDMDLALGGHDHDWKFLEKDKTFHVPFGPPSPGKQDPLGRTEYSFTTPFPVLIGGGPSAHGKEEGTVMLVEADPATLRARLRGAADGRLLKEFMATKDAR